METTPPDEATKALVQEYVDEIMTLQLTQMRRRPHPEIFESAWRLAFASLLANIIRDHRLVPVEMESYIDRVATALRLTVTNLVQFQDTHGWMLPPRLRE